MSSLSVCKNAEAVAESNGLTLVAGPGRQRHMPGIWVLRIDKAELALDDIVRLFNERFEIVDNVLELFT